MNTNDRELLELAAKAAGYVVDAEAQRGLIGSTMTATTNPATADGQHLKNSALTRESALLPRLDDR